MTFHNSRCYYLNKLFLSVIGQWPYQSRLERNVMSIITLFFLCSLGALELWGIIAGITDLSIIMENMSALLLNFLILVKLINHLCNKYKMKELLNYIEEIWERQTGPENDILRNYEEEGSILMTRYSIALYVMWILSTIPPVVARGIHSLLSTNETYSARFPFRLEHVFDMDKYFNWLMLHTFISVFYMVSVVIAVDSMFLVCIQNACAFFEVIRYNMEHIRSSTFMKSEPDVEDDEAYHIIIHCIKSHKHILRFSEMVSSAYAMSYLFLLGSITISLSFRMTELIVVDIQPDIIIRIATAVIAQILHLYYLSLISQRLIDYSSGLHEILQVSISYFTVLASFQ